MNHPMIFPNDTARARRADPITSHEAADSNTNRELVEEHVLHLFIRRGELGYTDRELTIAYFKDTTSPEADMESPRKRRSDLTKAGSVVATTETRPGRTGRRTTVYRAVAS